MSPCLLLDSSPSPAVLIVLQPGAGSWTSICREVLCLPVCLISRTGFLDGKALHVGKNLICHQVQYCTSRQAAELILLPLFLFPPYSCCGHCKAPCSPCISPFLLSEGRELCNQWGWSFCCVTAFIQLASSKSLLSAGCLCCSHI